ncbi:Putative acyl-CoA oxidase/dehydrogenase, central domain, acyl-CoA dehydrogenase/oxidase [Septoria linicola]|uniref:Acyl-CoA oxidase/dehydrogenase, central domain, acyl-CoA dehydrogenase/oxidase n=1 Tax=Septoria linicola TaxID=215465 RepID=A0A9Q9B2I9_9PEZI|nr:putative acyl-CoA oxidase/dehydrogenase, central domain, acyl-CoA dehydrogenase/oxidase [Septoria linicola]USW57010.1 Putative acyl-CoA oxidase/dehydrogenase, central domain, acyl-CoA dehydrogenase/oxidase [Septoria linicola]
MSHLAKRLTHNIARAHPRPCARASHTCRAKLSHAIGRRSVHAPAIEFLQNGNVDWTESQQLVRDSIAKIASQYDDEYWKDLDSKHKFSLDLHGALARDGWLGICMPEEYGGSALGISEASVMMQTLSESGGGMAAASSVHMNIFGLEPVVKFATEEQKQRWLVPLIAGEERACFGVTEPNTGLDTLKLQSLAKKNPDGKSYSVSGSKIWTSTAQTAQKILLLVRTTPLEDVKKPTQGLSLFYTDLDRSAVDVQEIEKLGRASVDSNILFFDGWKVPAEDLIGSEGEGFKQIMHGMNAERILIAAEALGLGFVALRKAALYAQDRVVFGRPIGKNQGIQHPLADSWMKLEAARLMTYQAARMYDQGHSTGEYANACKYLAADAAYEAAERAVLTHGGMGYAKEYHVERYFREAMLPRLAPVSRELILNYVGERVLGLPRSY